MTPASAHRRLLIVEDNDDNRVIYGAILRRFGFTVIEVANSEEGLALASSDPPELVLMDVGLPRMDGVEATRLLKSDPRTAHVPVVALTAHALATEKQRALLAGADGYLIKPVESGVLLREIERVLARARVQSSNVREQ